MSTIKDKGNNKRDKERFLLFLNDESVQKKKLGVFFFSCLTYKCSYQLLVMSIHYNIIYKKAVLY